jgi:hypothetical protein
MNVKAFSEENYGHDGEEVPSQNKIGNLDFIHFYGSGGGLSNNRSSDCSTVASKSSFLG